MLLTLTTLAAAATWTANDTLSLQAAVSLASAGDTVKVDVDLYDPADDVQVWIDKDLTIESSHSTEAALIPPMLITKATVQLKRLELSGEAPKSVGGFLNPVTSEVIECFTCGVMVYNNALVQGTGLRAVGWGGETAFRVVSAKAELGDVHLERVTTPISVQAGSGTTQLTLDGCTVTQNTQPIQITGASSSSTLAVEIDDCAFSDNASNSGPADLLLTQVDSLILADTSFEGSSSTDSSGSVEIYDVGDADLDNTRWEGVEGQRGALYILSTLSEASMPRVDLTNLDFLSNTQSGALEVEGYVRLVSKELKFDGNSAGEGAAVRIDKGQFECTSCRFMGNTASGAGGAISADDATLDIEHSWFCGNTSGSGANILYAAGGSNSMSHTVLMDQTGDIASVQVDAGGGLDLINVTWTGTDGYGLSGNLQDLRVWNSAIVGFQVGLAPANVQGSAAIDYNLWYDLDQESSNGGLEPGPQALYEHPLFAPRFDTSDCSHLPYPRALSPLRGSGDGTYADFRGALGDGVSFPWEDPPQGDSGDSDPGNPESLTDSQTDSPTDSIHSRDSPTGDSEPSDSDTLTWLSGACGGGGVPAGLLLLGAGLALATRRR